MSEDKLRRLLAAMAADQPGSGDRWGALAARRRRRQAWQAGGVGVTGIAVVLVGLLVMQGGGSTQTLVTDDPTPSATPTASVDPTPSTTPSASATPTASAPTPTASATRGVTAVPPVGRPPEPIRLAAVGAWSSPAPAGALFPSQRASVPQLLRNWADQVNGRGGISLRRIELTVLDTHGDTATLHKDVQQLVAQGIHGFVDTDVDASVASYLEDKQVPVLGGDLAASRWSSSPVLFSQGTDTAALADGLAVLAARRLPRGHLGVVCPDGDACDAPARLIEQRRAEKYGLDPTDLEKMPTSSTDYTSAVLTMRQKGVDVVAIALPPQQARGFARTAADQGWSPRYVLSSDLAAQSPVLDEPLLRGALTPQQVLPWPAAPAAFRAVLPDGAELSSALTSAWAATQLAQEAIRSMGDDPTSRAGLLAAAGALSDQTLSGVVPPLVPRQVQRCFYVGQVGSGTWRAPDGLATSCGKA